MGMGILFAVILAVAGLGALFVAPWIGAAFLAAAVISSLLGIFWLGIPAVAHVVRVDDGYATEMCVTQTAIAARELGFKVTVRADCCATLDPELEDIALHYLERVVGARIARS